MEYSQVERHSFLVRPFKGSNPFIPKAKMTVFNITATSKNKKELNFFILVLNRYLFFNSNNIKKISQKKIKKIRITLLKSPHVNKKSQEQFEIKFFKKKIILKIEKSLKYLLFLKKIYCSMFSNVNLKVKQMLNGKKNSFGNIFKSNLFIIKLEIFKIIIFKNFKILKHVNLCKKKIKFKYLLAKKTNYLVDSLELMGLLHLKSIF